jgi:hypothetical protein
MALDPQHASPSATGWAVITHSHRGPEIDMLTVSDTPRAAKVNWLAARALNARPTMVTAAWPDEMVEREFNDRAVSAGARVAAVHVIEAVAHG